MEFLKFLYIFTGLQVICRYVKKTYKPFLVNSAWTILAIILANVISLTVMSIHDHNFYLQFKRDMCGGIAMQHPNELFIGLVMLTLSGFMMTFVACFVVGVAFYAVVALIMLGAMIWNAPREIEKWAVKCWKRAKEK